MTIESETPTPPHRDIPWREYAFWTGLSLTVLLLLSRLLHLDADFPIATHGRFARDGVLYTDEGWYANNAMALFRHGGWYNELDMNFALMLPVHQLFHVVFFALFGVSIEAARLTTCLAYMGSTALVYSFLNRFCNLWIALFGAWMMATNFFFFAYSRVALSENLMVFLLLVAFWFASLAKEGARAWLYSGLAAFFTLAALLTKTSALPGVPVTVLILLAAGWKARGRWIRPIVAGVTIMGPLVAHRILIKHYFPADVAFFDSINVGMQLDFNFYNWLMTVEENVTVMKNIDKILYTPYFYGVVPLALILPTARRNPVLLFSALFVLGYMTAFGFYNNLQARYWVAYAPFFAAILACVVHGLWSLRWLHPAFEGLTYLLLAIGAVASLQNVREIITYHRQPRFTFRDTAREIHRIAVAETGQQRPVIMGHNSYTFALYVDIHPVNDLYAPSPMQARIDHYQPTFLITEDTVEVKPRHRVFYLYRNPADYAGRYEALTANYELEHVGNWEVLSRKYRDWDIHLYRLAPLKGTGSGSEIDTPAVTAD